MICYIILSLVVFLGHLDAKLSYDLHRLSGGSWRFLHMMFVCHFGVLLAVPLYKENYHYLVKIQAITPSRKRFWGGLTPILVCELLNILTLIFL